MKALRILALAAIICIPALLLPSCHLFELFFGGGDPLLETSTLTIHNDLADGIYEVTWSGYSIGSTGTVIVAGGGSVDGIPMDKSVSAQVGNGTDYLHFKKAMEPGIKYRSKEQFTVADVPFTYTLIDIVAE